MEMILKDLEKESFLFVDVSPKIKKPQFCSDDLIEKILNFMKCIQQKIQEKDQKDNTMIELTFDDAIDTTILNGWFLDYPFIYIHSNFFDLDTSDDHCLHFETLYLYQLFLNGEMIKSFSVPVDLIDDCMENKWIKKFHFKFEVKCKKFESSNLII
jgi:hypothetical protein